MSAPEVSVVIPTHGGRFLPAAVESVRRQTVTDWELVIVDDGSTDGTREVALGLAALDGRIRVVTQPNAGIAGARNRGLAEISAGSSYVAFLDHDDLWLPSTLEVLRAALIENRTASAAHGLARSIDAQDRTIEGPGREDRLPWNRRAVIDGRVQLWPLDRPTTFAVLAYDDCIASVGSGLIRRSALDRVGGFDHRAEPADDYDLWVRLSRVGEIPLVGVEVLAYREHGANRSLRPPPPRGRGTGYVRGKIITSPENTAEHRRIAVEGFRAHERLLLAERWSKLRDTWRRRDYRQVPRQVAAALARGAACLRGRPWSWQR